MAEPAPAKREAASPVTIIIVLGSPPNPQNSTADLVYFNCHSACWIWTSTDGGNTWSNCFVGEQNGYLVCGTGMSPACTPSVPVGTVITFEATAPNSNPPAKKPIATVTGTIKVGSGAKGTEHGK